MGLGAAVSYAAIIAGSRFVSSIFGLGGKRGHRPRYAAEYQDLRISTMQYNLPIPVYFGKHKVGGNYIWVGNKQATPVRQSTKGAVWLEWWYSADFAAALCEGEIEEIRGVWLGDKLAFELTDITITKYLGTSTQNPPQALVNSLRNPPAFRNTAYIFGSGGLGQQNAIPDIEAEIRGLKLTTYSNQYSNNAARVIREYLQNPHIGLGLSDSKLDISSFDSMASYCDDIIRTYSLRQSNFSQSSDLDDYTLTESGGTISINNGLQFQITANDTKADLEARSNFVLIGDFDIECQWILDQWPSSSTPHWHDDFYFGIVDANDSYIRISRYHARAGYDTVRMNRDIFYGGKSKAGWRYRENLSRGRSEIPWTSGYFRIVRTNDVITAYYKQNAGDSWTQMVDSHNATKTSIKYHSTAVKVIFGVQRFEDAGSKPLTVRILSWQTNSGGGSDIKRYTLDYGIIDARSAQDHLDDMLACFGGYLIYSNGQLKLEIDRPKSSVYSFNTSNIIEGSLTWNQITPLNERPSHVRVEYIDEAAEYRHAYAEASFDWHQERFGYKQETLSLLGIRNHDQAWRMANYYLRLKHYTNTACAFATGAEGLQLDPADIINITHPAPGWSNKPFKIIRLEYNQDDTVVIEAVEYDPAIYELPNEAPPISFDIPTDIAVVSYPQEIGRLIIVEHPLLPLIVVAFSLDGEVPFFGAVLYEEKDYSGQWVPVIKLTQPTVTALCYEYVAWNDTNIKIYDLQGYMSMGATLPFPVVIGTEVILVNNWDINTQTLQNCQRGMYGTTATSHNYGDVVWRALDGEVYFRWLSDDDVGKVFRYKVVALDKDGNEVNP
jgi:hypothetical protein